VNPSKFPLHDDSLINTNNSANFDDNLGNIVNIIVSYDMGWRILDFSTRNRKCKKCDMGYHNTNHDCRKNFRGSAKAMEADVGAELVNHSNIIKKAGLNVRVLIGDEDSSTIASVRRENSQRIFKLADSNHIKKHFRNDLYELKKSFKELTKKAQFFT